MYEKSNLRNKILIFIYERFHLDLEYVEKIKYPMNFSIQIYNFFIKKLQIKNKIQIKKNLLVLSNFKIWDPRIC